MLGSIGSQLGALQLGSIPAAVSEAITGSLTVTFGPPAIAAIGSLPLPSVIGPVGQPARRPLRIRGSVVVAIRPPRIVGHGLRAVEGRASVEIGPPSVAAVGGQTISGAASLTLASLIAARGTLTSLGQAVVGAIEPVVSANGLVVRPTVRPRLRSVPVAPTAPVPRRRHAQSQAMRPVATDVTTALEDDEDDVLKLLEIG